MLTPLILTFGFLISCPGNAPDAACKSHLDLTSSCLSLVSDVTNDDQIPAPEPANDDADPESVLEQLDCEDDDSSLFIAQIDLLVRSMPPGRLTWIDSTHPSPHHSPIRNPYLRC